MTWSSNMLILFGLVTTLLRFVNAHCPNKCSGHGDCSIYATCSCYDGYGAADCSEMTCPSSAAWSDVPTGINQAHNTAICSNRGICDTATGACTCMAGFTGAACEYHDCSNECNGLGKCMTMNQYATRYRNSQSVQYTYGTIWDANKIKGCVCDTGTGGYDCTLRTCPVGDDPLTTGQVNEVQLAKCAAISGKFLFYYNGIASPWIPWNANALTVQTALMSIPALSGGVKVAFSVSTATVCQPSPNIVIITFLQSFGNLPPLYTLMDPVMTAAGGAITISADGVTSFTDINGLKLVSVVCTKESNPCSDRGTCSLVDGTCTCFTSNGDVYGSSNGYGLAGTRGDCGYVASGLTVSTCPGDVLCSGQGVCNSATDRCSCVQNWAAGDCSERVCPSAFSWFDYPTSSEVAHRSYAVCSNMGFCDPAIGMCTCNSGFYGQACEYMSCPGNGVCSNNGQCMSLYEMALWATTNGVATPFTYGTDANNANTWDAKRIHGCMCDSGYTGYDCSLLTCPKGDDPGTYLDHDEVQLLQCKANYGSFTLSFRQYTTSNLYPNTTLSQLRSALMALPSINSYISVYMAVNGSVPNNTLSIHRPTLRTSQGEPGWGVFNSNGSFVQYSASQDSFAASNHTICSTGNAQVILIVFNTVYGNLPAVTASTSNLINTVGGSGAVGSGTVTIATDGQVINKIKSVAGTTENVECNNRGLCDRASGKCMCFAGWSSSDGMGGPGLTGDCGYRNDMLYSFVNNAP